MKQVHTHFYGDKQQQNFNNIMIKNGIESSSHFSSKENTMEKSFQYFESEIAIYKIIKENGLIQTEEDMIKIIEELENDGRISDRKREIMSEEQKQYILKRLEEEGIDLTTKIEEDKYWQDGQIVKTGVNKIFNEKLQEVKNNLESQLQLWEEGCSTRRNVNRNTTNI